MPRNGEQHIKQIYHAFDLIILNAVFLLSYFIKYGAFEGIFTTPSYLLIFEINVFWVLLSAIFRPYNNLRNARLIKIVRNYLQLTIIHFLLVTAFFAFQKLSYIPRMHILWMYSTFVPAIILWRVFIIFIERKIRLRGRNLRNVVIVGYSDIAEGLKSYFTNFPFYGYNFLGFFDDNRHSGSAGSIEELQAYCLGKDVHEIYVCLPNVDNQKVKEIIDFGEDNFIKVNLIPDFRGFSLKGINLQKFNHIPVLNVSAIPLDDYYNRLLKRVFDLVFAAFFMLFIFSWLYPLIALLIKLESRGPVFFIQKRAGKDNKPFSCFKFRTMVVNNEADTKQATKNDPRITRIGSFLRKTSIDELPQFINVLLGDMSLIGPRPHPLKLNEDFSPEIHKFMVRHSIKPGITGLAQAKGFRGETSTTESMKNRVRLDLFYLSNWSFNFDIKIILLTVASLIRGNEKAY